MQLGARRLAFAFALVVAYIRVQQGVRWLEIYADIAHLYGKFKSS